nr:MAG TPA: hypothetical protein [Caudoviricetes sp.]
MLKDIPGKKIFRFTNWRKQSEFLKVAFQNGMM